MTMSRVIRCKSRFIVKLDPPLSETQFCSMRELILQLKDVIGRRHLIEKLFKQGRCMFKHSSFENHYNSYKTNGILPSENDLGGAMGRRAIIPLCEIANTFNKRHNENIGFIEDDKQNTKTFLLTKMKSDTSAKGFVGESLSDSNSLSLSKETVRNYVSSSIAMGPKISAGILYNAARKKNCKGNSFKINAKLCRYGWSYWSTLMVQTDNVEPPKDLSDGAKLFLQASRDACGCQVQPKNMTYVLNFDEIGRWVWYSRSNDNKNNVMCKASKISSQEEVRGVSFVWKSTNSNENTCNGMTCKFLVLVRLQVSWHLCVFISMDWLILSYMRTLLSWRYLVWFQGGYANYL